MSAPFRKFTKDQINNRSQVKSLRFDRAFSARGFPFSRFSFLQKKTSVQRGITSAIVEQYPAIEPYMDDLIPKKSPVILGKSTSAHLNFVIVNKQVLFVEKDKQYIPTLRVLHQYPFLLKTVRVDKGAIKFVLGVLFFFYKKGLTHPQGDLSTDFAKDEYVAIYAEGKEHALAIGKTLMSRDQIRSENKGHGLEAVHFLGDGLWDIIEMD